jgi:anti-sigma B factor antagonist
MLDINVTGLHNVILIEVSGRIDSMTANDFGTAMMAPVEQGDVNLVLDLSGVDFMSSAGLREIVNVLKKVKRTSGDLRVVAPTDRVQEVFNMAGLDSILAIYATQNEAINSY